MLVLGLIIGCIVGVFIGITTMCFCFVAKVDDECRRYYKREAQENDDNE